MQSIRALFFAPIALLAGCAATPAPSPKATPPVSSSTPSPAPTAPAAPAATLDPKPANELWEGAISVGEGLKLRLVFHITPGADGALHATFDSPDQGAMGLPVDAVTRTATTLAFTVKKIGAEYSGALNASQTSAEGSFTQRGVGLALTLAKVEKASEPSRPQTPKPPWPYRSEDVSYANAAGGVTLAGTLTMPLGKGPFPAVILITGSGAQDRDETLFAHKPFLVLADDLTKKGVAVLRVDDRGVGGSTGNTVTSTTDDFAGDVLAGIAFLKGRGEIDPARIGLIGHSEGGLIAPIVASRSKDVAFAVLLAGPGLPGEDILVLQGSLVARAAGVPEAEVTRGAAVNKRIYAVLATVKDDKEAEAKIRAILKEAASDPALPKPPTNDDAIIAQLMNPWFRYFVKYDPRPALRKMTCPVLALNGERDLQVPPAENLAAIKKANPHIATKELPGLNHLFQTAKTGLPTEYATLEETFSPAALQEVSAFVVEQTHAK